LSVIGFHANAGLLPGGYIGVDIFFVISGYLITSIIARQIEQGSFTFWDFYARRCKRIFPSLIVVLLAVLALGWLFLLPDEYERLGKHIAAGAGFISNLVFWTESGYFDKAAEAKPLLHLWSLGIEEQFYLLWPPLFVLAWRRRWDLLTIAIGIVGVSFVANIVLLNLWQSAEAYYLPPTRFWELLFGAALAYAHQFRKPELDSFLKGFENLQATLGLSLIVVALAVLNNKILFPGWWGLLPTLGALLLISAGPSAWINRRVLAARGLVFIGLISYPLYLWHWPALSYANIITSGAPSATVRAIVLACAFLLSCLTYWIVEKPIRAKPHRAAFALMTSLAVVACSGLAVFAHQLHARSEAYGIQNIAKAASATWGFPGPNLKPIKTSLGFHFEEGHGRHKVLFIGDSHMEQYYPRIERLLLENPNHTKSVLFVTVRACPPVHEIPGVTSPKCADLVENALAVSQDSGVDTVVIAAAWNRYAFFQNKEAEIALRDLTATIARLKKNGKQVYLILPTPRGEAFDPAVLVKRSFETGFWVQQRVARSDVDVDLEPLSFRLASIASSQGAVPIKPVDYLCQKSYCPTLADDGMPVYTDNSHLRPAYVREHATFLDPIVSIQ
jgi:peptidoglycan/LPS O-acetylase OafA/YrhL